MKKIIPALVIVLFMIIGVRAFAGAGGIAHEGRKVP